MNRRVFGRKVTPVLSAILAVVLIFTAVPRRVFAEGSEYPVREGDFTTPRTGNVLMGIEGEFVTVDETAKQTLLARINEIRKEACDNGYPSPANRNVALTPADYVPLKWSRLEELIAAMRAVEASVRIGHARLAVQTSVFINNYGAPSNYENLAWNYGSATVDGILHGIEQWYGEKQDWLDNTAGAVTGHYTSMIDPRSKHIGISGFYNANARWSMTVTNHMSFSTGLDENLAGIGGKVTQITEVNPALITSLTVSGKNMMTVGETGTLTNRATVTAAVGYASFGQGPVFSGITWASSDPDVVAVDGDGNVTAVATGSATVTATLTGGRSAELDITVTRELDPDLRISDAGLVLTENLSVRFKVPASAFTGSNPAATDPFLKITFCGVEYTLTNYTEESGKYVFVFKNITPQKMADIIKVRLFCTLAGETEPSQIGAIDYSVVKYCKNMLDRYGHTAGYENFRKMLVDTLNYGAAAQKYVNYNTGNLANGVLTPEQASWGSSDSIFYNPNGYKPAYRTVDDPEVFWKASTVVLDEGFTLRFKFAAEDIEGLTINVTGTNGSSYTIQPASFEPIGTTDDGKPLYQVYFRGLNPAQVRTGYMFTFMRNGEEVSNTMRFEIDSFIGKKLGETSTTDPLYMFLFRILWYGDSVAAYVASH